MNYRYPKYPPIIIDAKVGIGVSSWVNIVITSSSTQYPFFVGISIGLSNNSKLVNFYNPERRSIYTTDDYNIYPGRHANTHFGINYDWGIFWVTIVNNLTLPIKPTLQSHRSVTSLQTLTQSREWSTKSFSCTQTH